MTRVDRRTFLAKGGMLGLTAVLAGCAVPSLDYYQRYLIIGAGEPPPEPWPRLASGRDSLISEGIRASVGKTMAMWYRSVQIENTRNPLPLETYESDIALSVVTEKGRPTQGAVISPSLCRTAQDGFNNKRLFFKALQIGVYRVQAIYPDKATTSRALSEFIVAWS